MKRIICTLLLLIFILSIIYITSFSSPMNVREYLNGKFPTIFIFYLASLEDLDTSETEFIDLLEKLPENEQRAYVREVYDNGFSGELLDELRHWQEQEREEAPSLKVAYPSQSEQRIWGSPLFVFGTTGPSSSVKVTVNNEEVKKFDYRTGNFLTLVEVPEEEEFPIVVAASRGRERTLIERTVFYPRLWEELPRDPLAIHPTHRQPQQDQTLIKGDKLRVIIQGSPDAEAVFQIGSNSNKVSMEEIDDLSLPLEGRGLYLGSYTLQTEDIPLLGETEPQVITVTLRRDDKEVSCELPGKVRFASGLPSHIVEVTGNRTRIYRVRADSFILHGSTLGGDGLPTQLVGYYLLPGTLLEVIGVAGDYLRLKLGAENYLIHQGDVKEMADIIKKPFTELSKIAMSETWNEITVCLNTRECVPFLIEDLIEEEHQQLKLFLYGVKKGENIKQEGEAPSVQKIEIECPLPEEGPDAALITIELNQPMVGLDYHWEGTELVIRMRKPPEISEDNPLQGRIIVIDPGHGDQYPGAIGPGDIHEKDVVLEIGKFLRDILEDRGAEVIMTRSEDIHMDLSERIDLALEHHADLFLSIHANAHAIGADAINYHGHMTIYNYAYNQKLAEIILDSLVERIGLPRARVWQRSDLVVLRYPEVPSVLIETAFMMHPDDNWYLLQSEYQREFAGAIMDGMITYFLSL
jgi:N-acetylmuramoyl-L-alanine amidase